MEVLMFVAVLALLGMLAMRFGHDSREHVYSKEEALAGLGLIRDEPAPPSNYVREVATEAAVPSAATEPATRAAGTV